MAIVIVCGGCQRTFEVADRYANQHIRCPKCGGVILVPATDLDPPVPVASRARSARPAHPLRERPADQSQAAPPRQVPDSPEGASAVIQWAQENDPVSRFRAQHANDWHIPVWCWFMLAGIVLFGGLGFVLWLRFGSRPIPATPTSPPFQEKVAHDPSDDGWMPIQLPPRPADPAMLAEFRAALQPQIVRIIVQDDQGTILKRATGWILDSNGLVVSTYQNLREGYRAEIEFDSGVTAKVLGYRAVRPDLDLAILQFESQSRTDSNVKRLDSQQKRMLFTGCPQEGGEVLAVHRDHENALVSVEGHVVRTVTTEDLPEPLRVFVRQLGGIENHVWIEHDGIVPAGANGGPLVAYDGQVIGINSWIGPQKSYALHIRHIRDALLDVFKRPQAMADHRIPGQRSDCFEPDGAVPEGP
ncbi:MAG: trypsin-like peptidase domain-containing protein [Pirellulales bacterium]|nr:trypsin-like peptidase domain-containing protein [Pirellulales bacterium]